MAATYSWKTSLADGLVTAIKMTAIQISTMVAKIEAYFISGNYTMYAKLTGVLAVAFPADLRYNSSVLQLYWLKIAAKIKEQLVQLMTGNSKTEGFRTVFQTKERSRLFEKL